MWLLNDYEDYRIIERLCGLLKPRTHRYGFTEYITPNELGLIQTRPRVLNPQNTKKGSDNMKTVTAISYIKNKQPIVQQLTIAAATTELKKAQEKKYTIVSTRVNGIHYTQVTLATEIKVYINKFTK